MIITANGTQPLEIEETAAQSVLYVGALGGATLKLKAHGIELKDGELTEGKQLVLIHGRFAPVVVETTGWTQNIEINIYEA